MPTRFYNIKIKKRRALTLKFFVLLIINFVIINMYLNAGESFLLYLVANILGIFICWLIGTGNPIQSKRKFAYSHLRHSVLSSNFEDKQGAVNISRMSNVKSLLRERETSDESNS